MNLAQMYANLPGAIRDGVIAKVVGAVPGFEARQNPLRKAKRFVAAASLPPAERYLRWISAFTDEAKQRLYSNDLAAETANFRTIGIIEPWFAKADGAGIVDASLLTDTMTYQPNDIVIKIDIATLTVQL